MEDESAEEELPLDVPPQWTVPGLPKSLTISIVGLALTAAAAVVLGGLAPAARSRQLVTLARSNPAPAGSYGAPAVISQGLFAAAATGSPAAHSQPTPAAVAPVTTVAPAAPVTAAPVTAPVTTAAPAPARPPASGGGGASPASQAVALVTAGMNGSIEVSGAARLTPGPIGLPLPIQYLRGGSIDQGVDYTAPGGTPLFAMGPGIVIQEGGIAGFGPNTPVLLITAGPLTGRTVYYGHAGPDTVPVGARVAVGQQIGVVGSGIVGMSTGPHLEVGFYPATGNMTAGTAMMAYINAIVGHPT